MAARIERATLKRSGRAIDEEGAVAEFTKHEPGTFSWAELQTKDVDAAVDLYSDLFGWEVHKEPIPGGGVYILFRVRGKDVAAASEMQEEQVAQGVPPHWNLYVTVEDAEQTCKEAEAAGGQIIVPTFDVLEFGRMAVIADPTGAAFCVWEPKTNIGAHLLGESGALSWAELITTDMDKAGAFYADVFGYDLMQWAPDGSYIAFQMGDKQVAGMAKAPSDDIRPYWGLYFAFDDVDGVVEKVKAAGGQTLLEPMDDPRVGRFGVVADPQGVAFGVVTPPSG